MAQTTKLELQQLLSAANAEREALRVQVAELTATVTMLKARVQQRSGVRTSTYVPPAPSPEILRKREVMAFARAYAMTNRRSITLAQAEELMAQEA
jgi:hypothetical protein